MVWCRKTNGDWGFGNLGVGLNVGWVFWLVGLIGWLVSWLVWLAWLVSWLVGCLVGWCGLKGGFETRAHKISSRSQKLCLL